ncbi:GNAT family N-acetyltransferase [Ensifer sp. MJa1]|uniref:GNAT family N-acetyltransferase n=1 Tax=Ensifer sp. MJa1 TaxID=2919888 RepID=UPI003008F916
MENTKKYPMVELSSVVTVEDVAPEERASVVSLHVDDDQTRFIASNSDSLKEADENEACVPLIIRAQGKAVGFAMYALDEDDGNYWIYRLMIDARVQGRGYGSSALGSIIARLRALPDCTCILLGVKPENVQALRVYERAGFRLAGDILDGELVMRLDF